MATYRHTPAGRGYESWLGYFGACNDYWTMIDKCGSQTCPAIHGSGVVEMVDLWEQSKHGAISRPASELNNSQTCSQGNQHAGCRFEDDILVAHAQQVITSHQETTDGSPLFLFWAAHAAHGPRQVPLANLTRFNQTIDWEQRRIYHALVTYFDGLVGDLIATVNNTLGWENTLIVFASDNGGDDAANNFPHRGAKFSNWQVHTYAVLCIGCFCFFFTVGRVVFTFPALCPAEPSHPVAEVSS